MNLRRKLTALFVVICMLAMDTAGYAQPIENILSLKGPRPGQGSDFNRIQIPSEYGSLEYTSAGPSPKTMIYIQDAHDSLEAQENIAKIIQYLTSEYGIQTVYEEGYEGPVPTDEVFSVIKDPSVRQKAAWFLMDHLRLGGAEYAHINRKKPVTRNQNPEAQNYGRWIMDHGLDFKLIGVDSLKLHLENIRWYQITAARQQDIRKDLWSLSLEIEKLANQFFPQELKEWMNLKSRFEAGRLPIQDYVARMLSGSLRDGSLTGEPSLGMHRAESVYPNLSLLLSGTAASDELPDAKTVFQEISRLEKDVASRFLKNERDQMIFDYYRKLALIRKLADLRLISEEYRAVKKEIKNFSTQEIGAFIVRETRQPLVLSRHWERDIRPAIRFYETSEARDQAMEKGLRGFFKPFSKEDTSILVFGGFHKKAIRKMLEQKGVSLITITPRITQPSPRHEAYYQKIMAAGYHDFERPFYLNRAARLLSTYELPSPKNFVRRIGEMIEAHPRVEIRALGSVIKRKLVGSEVVSSLGYLPQNQNEANDDSRAQVFQRIQELYSRKDDFGPVTVSFEDALTENEKRLGVLPLWMFFSDGRRIKGKKSMKLGRNTLPLARVDWIVSRIRGCLHLTMIGYKTEGESCQKKGLSCWVEKNNKFQWIEPDKTIQSGHHVNKAFSRKVSVIRRQIQQAAIKNQMMPEEEREVDLSGLLPDIRHEGGYPPEWLVETLKMLFRWDISSVVIPKGLTTLRIVMSNLADQTCLFKLVGARKEVRSKLSGKKMTDGEELRAMREALAYSQVKFANRLGVSAATVQQWEDAKVRIPESTLTSVKSFYKTESQKMMKTYRTSLGTVTPALLNQTFLHAHEKMQEEGFDEEIPGHVLRWISKWKFETKHIPYDVLVWMRKVYDKEAPALLKRIHNGTGFSEEVFSSAMNVKKPTFRQWEAGITRISFETLKKARQVYQKNAAGFLEFLRKQSSKTLPLWRKALNVSQEQYDKWMKKKAPIPFEVIENARKISGVTTNRYNPARMEARLAGFDRILTAPSVPEDKKQSSGHRSGLTYFNRDGKALKQAVEIVLSKLAPNESFQVLTLGSSTGDEGYEIAMSIAELRGNREPKPKSSVLITDLNPQSVADAQAGIVSKDNVLKGYKKFTSSRLPDEVIQQRADQFFHAVPEQEGLLKVLSPDEWQNQWNIGVDFRVLDITDPEQMQKILKERGKQHLILARNVHYASIDDPDEALRRHLQVLENIKGLLHENGLAVFSYQLFEPSGSYLSLQTRAHPERPPKSTAGPSFFLAEAERVEGSIDETHRLRPSGSTLSGIIQEASLGAFSLKDIAAYESFAQGNLNQHFSGNPIWGVMNYKIASAFVEILRRTGGWSSGLDRLFDEMVKNAKLFGPNQAIMTSFLFFLSRTDITDEEKEDLTIGLETALRDSLFKNVFQYYLSQAFQALKPEAWQRVEDALKMRDGWHFSSKAASGGGAVSRIRKAQLPPKTPSPIRETEAPLQPRKEIHAMPEKEIFVEIVGLLTPKIQQAVMQSTTALNELITNAWYEREKLSEEERLKQLQSIQEQLKHMPELASWNETELLSMESLPPAEQERLKPWLNAVRQGFRSWLERYAQDMGPFKSEYETMFDRMAQEGETPSSGQWNDLSVRLRARETLFWHELMVLPQLPMIDFQPSQQAIDFEDWIEKTYERCFFFGHEQADGDASMPLILGRKGANLAEMTWLKLPVPPGYTIPLGPEERLERFEIIPGRRKLYREGVREIEKRFNAMTGQNKKFGDPENPLFLSVRAGASESQPGLYQTSLKIGLHRSTLKGYIRQMKDPYAAYVRYIQYIHEYLKTIVRADDDQQEAFRKAVHAGKFQEILDNDPQDLLESLPRTPETLEALKDTVETAEEFFQRVAHRPFPNPEDQFMEAIQAVHQSLVRALIKHDHTFYAMNVQAFVNGAVWDDSSWTGVVFSRDPFNGEPHPAGNVKFQAEGPEVVTGYKVDYKFLEERDQEDWHPAEGLDGFAKKMPELYAQLRQITALLEKHHREIRDLEFTVESGRLFLLQDRGAENHLTGLAKARILMDMAEEGLLDPSEIKTKMTHAQMRDLRQYLLAPVVSPKAAPKKIAQGFPIIPGIGTGPVVNSSKKAMQGTVVMEVAPYENEKRDADYEYLASYPIAGVATRCGNQSDHAAVEIRGLGLNIPYVTGLGNLHIIEGEERVHLNDRALTPQHIVTVDGNTGAIYEGLAPDDFEPSEVKKILSGERAAQGSHLFRIYQMLETWLAEAQPGVRVRGLTPEGSDPLNVNEMRPEVRETNGPRISRRTFIQSSAGSFLAPHAAGGASQDLTAEESETVSNIIQDYKGIADGSFYDVFRASDVVFDREAIKPILKRLGEAHLITKIVLNAEQEAREALGDEGSPSNRLERMAFEIAMNDPSWLDLYIYIYDFVKEGIIKAREDLFDPIVIFNRAKGKGITWKAVQEDRKAAVLNLFFEDNAAVDSAAQTLGQFLTEDGIPTDAATVKNAYWEYLQEAVTKDAPIRGPHDYLRSDWIRQVQQKHYEVQARWIIQQLESRFGVDSSGGITVPSLKHAKVTNALVEFEDSARAEVAYLKKLILESELQAALGRNEISQSDYNRLWFEINHMSHEDLEKANPKAWAEQALEGPRRAFQDFWDGFYQTELNKRLVLPEPQALLDYMEAAVHQGKVDLWIEVGLEGTPSAVHWKVNNRRQAKAFLSEGEILMLRQAWAHKNLKAGHQYHLELKQGLSRGNLERILNQPYWERAIKTPSSPLIEVLIDYVLEMPASTLEGSDPLKGRSTTSGGQRIARSEVRVMTLPEKLSASSQSAKPLYDKETLDWLSRVHVVKADDQAALLQATRLELEEEGISGQRIHDFQDVDAAVSQVKKLRESGIPDQDIFVITDLAFGLADEKHKQRDGVDLINALRLDLKFQGQILVYSGSVPSTLALPDIFDQDASDFALGYLQKNSGKDDAPALLKAMIDCFKRAEAPAPDLSVPLTKSKQFDKVDMEHEGWAILNSLETIVRKKAAQGLLTCEAQGLQDVRNLLVRFQETLNRKQEALSRPEDPYQKLHDLNRWAAGLLSVIKDQGSPAFQTSPLASVLQELENQTRAFAGYLSLFQSFVYAERKAEVKVKLGKFFNNTQFPSHLQGRFMFRFRDKQSPDPAEVLPPDILDQEVPSAEGFILGVLLDNIREAHQARGRDSKERIPVDLEVSQAASESFQTLTLSLRDSEGGLQGITAENAFGPGAKGKEREGRAGYGLYFAKYLAQEHGLALSIEEEAALGPAAGVRAAVTWKKSLIAFVAKDEGAKKEVPVLNDIQARLQQKADRMGGKIAGFEGLEEAAKDIPIETPSWEKLLNQELWIPYTEANRTLVEKGDLIAGHFENLVDRIYTAASASEDPAAFFKILEPVLKQQFKIDSPEELFSPEFSLERLRNAEGGLDRRKVRKILEDYLDRLSQEFVMPESVTALVAERTEKLLQKIKARGEEHHGIILFRGSDRADDTFLENRPGEVMTLEGAPWEAVQKTRQILQWKVRDGWISRRKKLTEESFSMALMNHRWTDAGFVAFTNLYGRLVVVFNWGQTSAITSTDGNALIMEFEIDPEGRVRRHWIRAPYWRYPSHIDFKGRHYSKSGDKENFRDLLEFIQQNTITVQNRYAKRNSKYYSPMDEARLYQLAETLWKIQHHQAFGYPLVVEGGMFRDTALPVLTFQARPMVGIPVTNYEPLPGEEPVKTKDVFDSDMAMGRGSVTELPVVVISEEASETDIADVDAKFPEGYIRVQSDAANKDPGHARVLVDPRNASWFAHNMHRLMPRIEQGSVFYAAGTSLQKNFRESLEYEEILPGIRMSLQPVSAFSNGLQTRFHIREKRKDVILSPEDEEHQRAFPASVFQSFQAALAANGFSKEVVLYDDSLDMTDVKETWEKNWNIKFHWVSNFEDAAATIRRLGQRSLFIGHASGGGLDALEYLNAQNVRFAVAAIVTGGPFDKLRDYLRTSGLADFVEKYQVWLFSWDYFGEVLYEEILNCNQALEESKKNSGSSSFDGAVPSWESLPVDLSKVYSLEEVIKAQGVPKEIVYYDATRQAFSKQQTKSWTKKGVPAHSVFTLEEAREKVLALGPRCLFIGHFSGQGLEALKYLKNENAWPSAAVLVSAADSEDLEIALSQKGLQQSVEQKKLWVQHWDWMDSLIKDLAIMNKTLEKQRRSRSRKPAGSGKSVEEVREIMREMNQVLDEDCMQSQQYDSMAYVKVYDELEKQFLTALSEEDRWQVTEVFNSLRSEWDPSCYGDYPDAWQFPLTQSARDFLYQLEKELGYPFYPALEDSKAVIIIRALADYARRQELVEKGITEIRTPAGDMVPIRTSGILRVVAVDDERKRLDAYRSYFENVPGLEFHLFQDPDPAQEFLKNKAVDLLITDISFDGVDHAEALVETALETASGKQSRVTVVPVSGMGKDSKPARLLRKIAEKNPEVLEVSNPIAPAEWKEAIPGLLDYVRRSRRSETRRSATSLRAEVHLSSVTPGTASGGLLSDLSEVHLSSVTPGTTPGGQRIDRSDPPAKQDGFVPFSRAEAREKERQVFLSLGGGDVFPGTYRRESRQTPWRVLNLQEKFQTWFYFPFLIQKPTHAEPQKNRTSINLLKREKDWKKLFAKPAARIMEKTFSINRWIKSLLSNVRTFVGLVMARMVNEFSRIVNIIMQYSQFSSVWLTSRYVPESTERAELREAKQGNLEEIATKLAGKMTQGMGDPGLVRQQIQRHLEAIKEKPEGQIFLDYFVWFRNKCQPWIQTLFDLDITKRYSLASVVVRKLDQHRQSLLVETMKDFQIEDKQRSFAKKLWAQLKRMEAILEKSEPWQWTLFLAVLDATRTTEDLQDALDRAVQWVKTYETWLNHKGLVRSFRTALGRYLESMPNDAMREAQGELPDAEEIFKRLQIFHRLFELNQADAMCLAAKLINCVIENKGLFGGEEGDLRGGQVVHFKGQRNELRHDFDFEIKPLDASMQWENQVGLSRINNRLRIQINRHRYEWPVNHEQFRSHDRIARELAQSLRKYFGLEAESRQGQFVLNGKAFDLLSDDLTGLKTCLIKALKIRDLVMTQNRISGEYGKKVLRILTGNRIFTISSRKQIRVHHFKNRLKEIGISARDSQDFTQIQIQVARDDWSPPLRIKEEFGLLVVTIARALNAAGTASTRNEMREETLETEHGVNRDVQGTTSGKIKDAFPRVAGFLRNSGIGDALLEGMKASAPEKRNRILMTYEQLEKINRESPLSDETITILLPRIYDELTRLRENASPGEIEGAVQTAQKGTDQMFAPYRGLSFLQPAGWEVEIHPDLFLDDPLGDYRGQRFQALQELYLLGYYPDLVDHDLRAKLTHYDSLKANTFMEIRSRAVRSPSGLAYLQSRLVQDYSFLRNLSCYASQISVQIPERGGFDWDVLLPDLRDPILFPVLFLMTEDVRAGELIPERRVRIPPWRQFVHKLILKEADQQGLPWRIKFRPIGNAPADEKAILQNMRTIQILASLGMHTKGDLLWDEYRTMLQKLLAAFQIKYTKPPRVNVSFVDPYSDGGPDYADVLQRTGWQTRPDRQASELGNELTRLVERILLKALQDSNNGDLKGVPYSQSLKALPPGITLETAKPEDWAELQDFRQREFAAKMDGNALQITEPILKFGITTEGFVGFVLLARQNKKIAGYVFCTQDLNPNQMWIHELAVQENLNHLGIGTHLLNEAVERVIRQYPALQSIDLSDASQFGWAGKIASKLGFVHYGSGRYQLDLRRQQSNRSEDRLEALKKAGFETLKSERIPTGFRESFHAKTHTIVAKLSRRRQVVGPAPGFVPMIKPGRRTELRTRKDSREFDAQAAANYLIDLFRREPEWVLLPTYKRMGSDLNCHQATVGNHFYRVVKKLEEMVGALKDKEPLLARRLARAIEIYRDREKGAALMILDDFKDHPDLRRMPDLEKLARQAGFLGDLEHNLLKIVKRLEGILELSDESREFKKRLQTAIDFYRDPDEAAAKAMVQNLIEKPRRRAAPSAEELAGWFGTEPDFFGPFYPDILWIALYELQSPNKRDTRSTQIQEIISSALSEALRVYALPQNRELVRQAVQAIAEPFMNESETIQHFLTPVQAEGLSLMDQTVFDLPDAAALAKRIGAPEQTVEQNFPEIVYQVQHIVTTVQMTPAVSQLGQAVARWNVKHQEDLRMAAKAVDYLKGQFLGKNPPKQIPETTELAKKIRADPDKVLTYYAWILRKFQEKIFTGQIPLGSQAKQNFRTAILQNPFVMLDENHLARKENRWWDTNDLEVMEYYRKGRKLGQPALKRFVAEEVVPVVEAALKSPDDILKVLEIGAGDGQLWEWAKPGFNDLIRQAAQGNSWIQMDGQWAYLKQAVNGSRQGLQFTLQDSFPLKEASVPAITTLAALDTVPLAHLDEVVQKMADALAPGAPLVAMLDLKINLSPDIEEAKRQNLLFIPGVQKNPQGRYLPSQGCFYIDWETMRTQLEKSKDLETKGMKDFVDFYLGCQADFLAMALGNREIWEKAAPEFEKLIKKAEDMKAVKFRYDEFLESLHMKRLEEAAKSAGLEIEFAGEKRKTYDFARSLFPEAPSECNRIRWKTGLVSLFQDESVPEGRMAVELGVYLLVARKPQPLSNKTRTETRSQTSETKDPELSFSRSSIRRVFSKPGTEAKRVVMDVATFEALSDEQRAEIYKLFEATAESGIEFHFYYDTDRALTAPFQTLSAFEKKYSHVKMQLMVPGTSVPGSKNLARRVPGTMQGIHVTKEGVTSFLSGNENRVLRVHYPAQSTEPGLLTAALLLLESGQEAFFRQHRFLSEIPGFLHSKIRRFLDSYRVFTVSA